MRIEGVSHAGRDLSVLPAQCWGDKQAIETTGPMDLSPLKSDIIILHFEWGTATPPSPVGLGFQKSLAKSVGNLHSRARQVHNENL